MILFQVILELRKQNGSYSITVTNTALSLCHDFIQYSDSLTDTK